VQEFRIKSSLQSVNQNDFIYIMIIEDIPNMFV